MPPATIIAPAPRDARDVLLAAAASGVEVAFAAGEAFGYTAPDGASTSEHNAACRHVVAAGGQEAVGLLGETPEQAAQVGWVVGWDGGGGGSGTQRAAIGADRTPARPPIPPDRRLAVSPPF